MQGRHLLATIRQYYDKARASFPVKTSWRRPHKCHTTAGSENRNSCLGFLLFGQQDRRGRLISTVSKGILLNVFIYDVVRRWLTALMFATWSLKAKLNVIIMYITLAPQLNVCSLLFLLRVNQRTRWSIYVSSSCHSRLASGSVGRSKHWEFRHSVWTYWCVCLKPQPLVLQLVLRT